MFRTSNRMNGEPIGVPPISPTKLPRPSIEGLVWKPNLRRIKRGLFSTKDGQACEGNQTGENYTTTPEPINNGKAHQRWVNGAWILKQEEEAVNIDIVPRTPAALLPSPGLVNSSRERPKGPRPPKDGKGFSFRQRSLSISRSQPELTTPESLKSTPQSSPSRMDKKRLPPLPPFPIPPAVAYVPKHAASDFSKIIERKPIPVEGQVSPTTRPKTAPIPAPGPYVPQHAASDFSKLAEQKKPDQMIPDALAIKPKPKPKVAAYIPQHAASDFSKLNIQPSPVDPFFTPQQDEEQTDYQKFLAEARIAAARTFNTVGIFSPNKITPKTTEAVNQITATHHSSLREQTLSASEHSSRPASGAGSSSVFDVVGEHLKPSRPASISTQRTTFTSNADKKSIAPSVSTEEQISGNRWSTMVNGSIRSSFSSKEKDEDGDEKEKAKRRRRRRMPTAPGLKKFNKAVDKGLIY